MSERIINLSRYYEPHSINFSDALAEIRRGRKKEHWIWYVWPVIDGIWSSNVTRYFALMDAEEARAFLHDPQLGGGLLEITEAFLSLETGNALEVLGSDVDVEKVQACMTLFDRIAGREYPLFRKVLDKYYGGTEHAKTAALLSNAG